MYPSLARVRGHSRSSAFYEHVHIVLFYAIRSNGYVGGRRAKQSNMHNWFVQAAVPATSLLGTQASPESLIET